MTDLSDNIQCPICGMISWNPNDIKYGYCEKCHEFTTIRDEDIEFSMKINGIIDTPKTVQQWLDDFIEWIESRGETFCGSTNMESMTPKEGRETLKRFWELYNGAFPEEERDENGYPPEEKER